LGVFLPVEINLFYPLQLPLCHLIHFGDAFKGSKAVGWAAAMSVDIVCPDDPTAVQGAGNEMIGTRRVLSRFFCGRHLEYQCFNARRPAPVNLTSGSSAFCPTQLEVAHGKWPQTNPAGLIHSDDGGIEKNVAAVMSEGLLFIFRRERYRRVAFGTFVMYG
jgi:hypothetical protein